MPRCSCAVFNVSKLGQRWPTCYARRCARASAARSAALYADAALVVRPSYIRRLCQWRAFTVSTRAAARRSRRARAADRERQSVVVVATAAVGATAIATATTLSIVIVGGLHSSERAVQRRRLATACAHLQSVQRDAHGARGSNERRRHSPLAATVEQARSIGTKVRPSACLFSLISSHAAISQCRVRFERHAGRRRRRRVAHRAAQHANSRVAARRRSRATVSACERVVSRFVERVRSFFLRADSGATTAFLCCRRRATSSSFRSARRAKSTAFTHRPRYVSLCRQKRVRCP